MLKSLHIQSYAIIDDLTIDFDRGFNVFTGETGAGKSIIIGALSFLSDKRADTSVIKSNANKAVIEGVFSIEDKDVHLKEILDEALIDYDNELIVKRVISRDSNSTIKVNGSTVTLSFLDELLTPLIDIHSQKDSQYLFNKKNHLILLDRYMNNGSLINEYKDAYKEYRKLNNEYNELKNSTYSESDLEYITFELDEIRKADLTSEEESDLINKEKKYRMMEKYITNLSGAVELYNGYEGIKEKIQSLVKVMDIDDETIQNERKAIESLYYDIDDHMSNIEKIYSSLDDGEMNIEVIEERLFVYSKLKRKYSKDTDELNAFANELEERINSYKDRDAILENKLKALNKAKETVLTIGNKLSEERRNRALSLEKEVVLQAKDLLLPDTDFRIMFNEKEPDETGIDDVEFYLSLNKGEDIKPLKNIASGGEISRIMLALKIIFSRLSDTKLIVFDEIDTGVSGKAALSIGSKMSLISKDLEVIAISHLAPVAAFADHHYYIYKQVVNENTATSVRKLDTSDIFKELSLMSTGSVTEESYINAKALYEKCQSLK